jgi:methanogenic corrinoid protein MtbC1
MAKELNFYTRLYDGFMSNKMCDDYISTFEETMKKDAEEVKKTSICTGPVRPDGHQICGNCNCQRMNPMGFDRFADLNSNAMKSFLSIVETYKKDTTLHSTQWPKNIMWEEFRMKRFLVGDGSKDAEQFGEHVDVTSHAQAKRMLILMVYLNDDFNGGETVFPYYGDAIKPKKGSVLIFPPLWMYLHKGNPPLAPGYAKYFLMTYLNYEPIKN